MSWQKLRPYGNRALVKLDTRASHHGPIEIPDEYRRQPEFGTVIAVGRPLPSADGTLWPIAVEVGQRVILGKWNGTPIEPPDDDPTGEYFIMNIDALGNTAGIQDIYGVVEERSE